MTIRRASSRTLMGALCLAVGFSLANPVAATAKTDGPTTVDTAPSGAGEHDVTVTGPSHMRLRSGCRTTYSLAVHFDVAAGEDYWVHLRGQDSQGHTIDGATVSGTATTTDRITVKRPLLLCGATHDAGVGKLQVSVHVGDEQINGTARTVIRYADRVRLKKPKRAVKRGSRVRLSGRWDRGRGFGHGVGYYNRKAVRVRIWFKPAGRSWRKIATSRIDGQGRWHKSVKVKRSGRYQARIKKSERYLPARSKVRRVRAR